VLQPKTGAAKKQPEGDTITVVPGIEH